MKYDAFISYRHTPLDMEMAKKVHYALETYHIPKSVQKKTGKKKIERVFRDQEELPIGSDLNDNISGALQNSEYLIVICSPDTPSSYWVSKEIDTFIELHGREKILAVLVAGEPAESFLPQLLMDDQGNPVEPLAADMRAADPKERKKIFKTEILRLAAPVIGCSYDDLKQRHRERILKRNIAIASTAAAIIAVAGTAFGIYNAGVADRMEKLANEKSQLAEEKSQLAEEKTTLAEEKTVLANKMEKLAGEKSQLAEEKTQLADRILLEYRQKQKNQSKFYAEKALSVFNTGNRAAAALIASAGLPAEDDDRPFVPEAEYALSKILYAYDSGKTLGYDRVLTHEMGVKSMTESEDGKYLISVDYGNKVYVWSLDTFELLADIPPIIKENSFITPVRNATADDEGIYILNDKGFFKYDYQGNVIYEKEIQNASGGYISTDKGKAVVTSGLFYIVFDLKTGEILKENESKETKSEIDEYVYSGNAYDCIDSTKVVLPMTVYMNGTEGRLTVLDTAGYSEETYSVSRPYIARALLMPDGSAVVLSSSDTFYVDENPYFSLDYIKPGNEKAWSVSIPLTSDEKLNFISILRTFEYDSVQYISLVIDEKIFTFKADDGTLVSKLPLLINSNVKSLNVIKDSNRAFVTYDNGIIDIVNLLSGEFTSRNSVDTQVAVSQLEMIDSGIAVRSDISNNIYILKYHTAPDLEEFFVNADFSSVMGVSPVSGYLVTRDTSALSYKFYDAEGNLLYVLDGTTEDRIALETSFLGDKFIIAEYHGIEEIDPIKKETKFYSYADMSDMESGTAITFSADGKYAVVWNFFDMMVLDIENKKSVYSEKTNSMFGCGVISSDGNTLLVSIIGENLKVVDIASNTTKTYENDSLKALGNAKANRYLCMSKDGKKAAIACSDGYIRVLGIPVGEVLYEFLCPAMTKCFLCFSPDGNAVFVQGEDYRLNVWSQDNSGEAECLSVSEEMYISTGFIEDPDGYMAICNGDSTLLFKTDSYGMLTFVEDGVAYLPKDKSFIVKRGDTFYKTYYKDYKKLIKEVKDQFKDAELTQEEKATYNIE